jgi:predicted transcriptional regulator
MKIDNMVMSTCAADAQMTVGEAFEECMRHQVPGLPFRNKGGLITGKVSIRDILKNTLLPEYLVAHAHLMGDRLDRLNIPELKAKHILTVPVRHFVLSDYASIDSDAPVIKAIAVMEHYKTGYIFVIDGQEYKGTVTYLAIARRILELR